MAMLYYKQWAIMCDNHNFGTVKTNTYHLFYCLTIRLCIDLRLLNTPCAVDLSSELCSPTPSIVDAFLVA